MGTRIAARIIGILLGTVVLTSCVTTLHEDVDIATGQVRASRYVLGCPVSERIEGSPLSEVVPPELVAEATPQWRRVNSFSGWRRISPHYIFHGAFGQIGELSMIWERAEAYGLPAEIKQKTALHVLALWQYSNDDSLAADYIHELWGLTDEDKRARLIEALARLDMPRVETDGAQITRTVFYPTGMPLDSVQGYLDADGAFVRRGVWMRWYSDGTLELYGHFENGQHHGRRFEWDKHRTLTSIEAFTHGELTEFVSDQLSKHPEYSTAQRLARDEAAKRPDQPPSQQLLQHD